MNPFLQSLAPAPALPADQPPPGALSQLLDGVWQYFSQVSGAEYLFYAIALLAVGCAIATVSSRNPVVAAVWLVASFFCVAICYVMLSATFLAALQVLVYAGAMMVLFVFVVMVLDVDERGKEAKPPPERARRRLYKVAATGLGLLLTWVLWGTLTRQVPAQGRTIAADFGTADAVGRELFGSALFAFEAVSLLLLAAVIGAVVVARSRRERIKEAKASGLSGDGLHAAGLGEVHEGDPVELTDAQVRQPHPAMDFGQPSAGGHEGGT